MAASKSFQLRSLRPFHRLLEFRRTCWQLRVLARCGLSRLRIAEEAINRRQTLQRKWELLALMGYVQSLKPKVVLEVGTYQGGTLFCWSRICPSDTTFISVDLPGGAFGGGYNADDVQRFQTFLNPGQSLHCLRMDSHAVETVQEVRNLLGDRSVDFLFLDGDHSYEGVRADFELYGPLVRSGGIIAFHDIVEHSHMPACRVHEFWREIKKSCSALELVDRDGFDTWGGIGVVIQS
jgi:predicted O-methyltransferase YrrM